MKRLGLYLLFAALLVSGCQGVAPPIGGVASQAGLVALPAWQNSLYVHPAGSAGAPGTAARPTTLAAALDKLSAGGTVYLKTDAGRVTDYRQPLILSGRVAVNLYGVGTGFALFPYVQLTGCSDVQLSRVCAGPSPVSTFGLTDCRNVKLVQCVGRDAGPGNTKVFSTNRCESITFDGCYGFGDARKIFEFYKSRNVTVARCFAQGGFWRGGFGNDQTPVMAYSTAYDTVGVDFLQCWGTWDEKNSPPAGAAYGIFAVDRNQAEYGFGLEANVQVRLCTAYTLPGQNVTAMIGAIFQTGLSDVAISECNVLLAHPVRPYLLGQKTYGGQRCSATRLFVKAPAAGAATPNWGLSIATAPNALPPVIPFPAAAMKLLGGPDLFDHAAKLQAMTR